MFYSIDELKKLERELLDNSVNLKRWQDAAATELIGAVAAGYKYVITCIVIQNLGALSVLDFYDALVAGVAEANHKVSVDAKATDTTVVDGLNLIFATAASVAASVCAAPHNLKITLCGYRLPV